MKKESRQKLYRIHEKMKQRCHNEKAPDYNRYGAKGIKLCEEWQSYYNFKEWSLKNGFSYELTIDRIDSTKGYCPENCRWSDIFVQNANRGISKRNTSGYIGITFIKNKNMWKATISIKNKVKFIGMYKNKIEAAKARDTYIVENNLPHKLNGILKCELQNIKIGRLMYV